MFDEGGIFTREGVVAPNSKKKKDANGVQLREIETPGKGGRAEDRRITFLRQGLGLSAWMGRVIEGSHFRHRARGPLAILAVGQFSEMRGHMRATDGKLVGLGVEAEFVPVRLQPVY